MRLIDADDLAAKIMMDAPDFMDGGSSITKAFILAMVRTRSVTPTVDAEAQIKNLDESLEKAREEIKWLRGMLKEQEPIEVLHHEAPYGYPFNTGKCPVCFQELDEGDNFCRSCGKAVKWK